MSLATGRERRNRLEPEVRRTAIGLLIVLGTALLAVLLQCSAKQSPAAMMSTVVPPAVPSTTLGLGDTGTPTPASSVAWTGDFEAGLSGWEPRLAAPDRAQVYAAGSTSGPAPRQGQYAARLTASDSDFRSPNVRAQLDGTYAVHNGDDIYWRYSVFFPDNFPTTAGLSPDFFTFAEFMGPPYDGPSAFGNVSVVSDSSDQQRVAWVRGPEKAYDQPWSAPLERGRWHDFVFHVVFSTDPARGSVQLWYDGEPQLLNGTSALPMQTIRPSNTQGLFPVLTNYRTADSVPGEVTIYVDGAVLGRELDDVGGAGGP